MEESSLHALPECAGEKALFNEAEKMKMVRCTNPNPIPQDILFEILTRLPVKSLLRFKCVSTLWLSTITDRNFIDSCSFRSRAYPKLLVTCIPFLVKSPDHIFFSTEYLESPSNQCEKNIIKFTHNFTIRDSFFSSPQAIHGLICYGTSSHLTISNLSTKKRISIEFPLPHGIKSYFDRLLSFGYDPTDNEYKILFSLRRKDKFIMEHFVYNLREKTWRSINAACPYHFQGDNASICIEGTIYYKARNAELRNNCLMAFEVRSETFHVIPFPPPCTEEPPKLWCLTLVELEGSVALIEFKPSTSNDPNSHVHIMTLEDPFKGVWSYKDFKIPLGLSSSKRLSSVYGDELLFAPIVACEENRNLGSAIKQLL